MSAFDAAAADLTRSADAVRDAATRSIGDGATRGAAAARGSHAPYPYRYAARIAAAAKATPVKTTGDVIQATVKVGGRGRVFSGGGSVSRLVWGAEYGAKTGDMARGKGTARGRLAQFPPRRRDGWALTPAIEQAQRQLDADTDAAFARALSLPAAG